MIFNFFSFIFSPNCNPCSWGSIAGVTVADGTLSFAEYIFNYPNYQISRCQNKSKYCPSHPPLRKTVGASKKMQKSTFVPLYYFLLLSTPPPTTTTTKTTSTNRNLIPLCSSTIWSGSSLDDKWCEMIRSRDDRPRQKNELYASRQP